MDEKKVRDILYDLVKVLEMAEEVETETLDFKNIPVENLEVVIEALEKQLPKKADEDECTEKTHYKCPTCGRIPLTVYADGYQLGTTPKYCEGCGQNLDWSVKNE